MKDKLPCRLIEHIGYRIVIGLSWGHRCPNAYGTGKPGQHFAQCAVEDVLLKNDLDPKRSSDDYSEEKWPTVCDHCKAQVPEDETDDIHKFSSRRLLYNTDSGKPEPGDMYYAPWYHEPDTKKHMCRWDNCDDPRGHLIVILPNGSSWDLDSRASNCTMKNDRLHRCWVRHGEPPAITVDKNGHTCQAGAGSILVDKYHGFLRDGCLVKC